MSQEEKFITLAPHEESANDAEELDPEVLRKKVEEAEKFFKEYESEDAEKKIRRDSLNDLKRKYQKSLIAYTNELPLLATVYKLCDAYANQIANRGGMSEAKKNEALAKIEKEVEKPEIFAELAKVGLNRANFFTVNDIIGIGTLKAVINRNLFPPPPKVKKVRNLSEGNATDSDNITPKSLVPEQEAREAEGDSTDAPEADRISPETISNNVHIAATSPAAQSPEVAVAESEKTRLQKIYENESSKQLNTWEELEKSIYEAEEVIKVEGSDNKKIYLPYEGNRTPLIKPIFVLKGDINRKLNEYNFERLRSLKNDALKKEACEEFIRLAINNNGRFKAITPGNNIREKARILAERDIVERFNHEAPLKQKNDLRDAPRETAPKKGFELEKQKILGAAESDAFINFALTRNVGLIEQEIKAREKNIETFRGLMPRTAQNLGIDKDAAILELNAAISMLSTIKEYVEANEEEKPLKKIEILAKKIELRRQKLEKAVTAVDSLTTDFSKAVEELQALTTNNV